MTTDTTAEPTGDSATAERRFETLAYEVAGGVAHLRLDRASGANAVNPALARDLRDVMIDISLDEAVKAVSVTAAGKVFCAGGDLKEFHAAGDGLPAMAAAMLSDFHNAIYRMNRMPKPVVAGVSGAAGGAGLSLVSAFDLVVCGESAKFTMAYTRAGVTPDGTSTYFLARHIGLRRMLDLTLTNRVLTATEAEAWGLVNRVVAHDELLPTCRRLAADIAGNDPVGVARMLATYREQEAAASADGWRLENEAAREFGRRVGFEPAEVEARRRAIIDRGRGQLG